MSDKNSVKGVLVVVLAALFVMALAYQTQASVFSSSGTPFSYTGKIVALDTHDGILTVQAGPGDELTFNLNGNGAVMKCGMSESFANLKIGDVVTVSYFDPGDGSYIANEIDFGSGGMDRC